MTKYLINLVCIIGIAGAAHAGAVADLQITADGHAYLVFAADAGDLTGYSIEDLLSTASYYTPAVAIPNGALDPLVLQNNGSEAGGTGQYATAWSSLAIQGPVSGVTLGALSVPDDWFTEGGSLNPAAGIANAYIAETNAQGSLARADGVPVYIGQIFDSGIGGTMAPIEAVDFTPVTGRLANLRFRTADASASVQVVTGGVSFLEAAALVAGSTPLAGVAYQETSAVRSATPVASDPVGKVGTRIDAAYVAPGNTTVIDLEVVDAGTPAIDGANTVTTTTFVGEGVRGVGLPADGYLLVNGKLLPINYADLVETNVTATGAFVSAHLRIQAIDGASTVAIDTDFSPVGVDVLGVNGTLASTMAVSLVRGDFSFDDDSTVVDIDAITAEINGKAIGARSLLFDVNGDNVVNHWDRWELVNELVSVTLNGPGTSIADANLNGSAALDDYVALQNNWGNGGRTWADADFSGNGNVGLEDYVILQNNWGDPAVPIFPEGVPPLAPGAAAPASVPEPATMTLLAIGGLALIRRRRRA